MTYKFPIGTIVECVNRSQGVYWGVGKIVRHSDLGYVVRFIESPLDLRVGKDWLPWYDSELTRTGEQLLL